MKVLLIGYNVQDDIFPLAFNYLVEFAKKDNFQVDFIIKEFSVGNRVSFAANKAIEIQTLAYIQEINPDLVCFSSYIWSIDIIRDVCNNLKKITNNIKILIGGVEATKECLSFSDYFISLEGEKAFSLLISYLSGKKDVTLSSIPNLSYKKDGIIKTNSVELISNLDIIPFPYTKSNGGSFNSIRIETSRGCPFNCRYCYYANSKKQREFSIEYLDKNLDTLFEYFTFKNLTIIDPNLNVNINRMKSILNLINKKAKKYSKKFVLNFELKPELITKDLIEFLNGFSLEINAELGLQSTNSGVMVESDRFYNLDKVKEGLQLLNDSNISYKIDLMYGLPQDNFYKFLNSCRFLLKYAKSQNQLPAHHFMLLNNTSFCEDNNKILRLNEQNSSMVIKTTTQGPLELYKTKLFVEMLNLELKLN